MPPRLPGPSGLKSMTLCLRPAPSTMPLPTTLQPLIHRATLTQRDRSNHLANDPYRQAQREERRQRNLARRGNLSATRTAAHGDPVAGLPTPFLVSLDSAGQAEFSTVKKDDEGRPLEEAQPLPTSKHILNYQLTQAELDEAIAMGYELTKPEEDTTSSGAAATPRTPMGLLDPDFARLDNDAGSHEARHLKAVEALRRITTLENASSRDRRHANIRRIVEEFGRHVTDHTVRQKGLAWNQTERMEKLRGGPDTGSSEVQIAILTTKIRVLARMLAGPKGNKDKHNKKNLRLLCHRRQKLLKYMERKERGSGRWEHMIQTLGLSPATWKDQIEIR